MAGTKHSPTLNELLKMARERSGQQKRSFTDTATMAGGGGGAPPMDPAAMGGGMPMDPAAMGGAPPMDPAAMGGGTDPLQAIMSKLDQISAGGGGAAGGGAGGGIKPKIDVNVEIMQMKNLLARICDHLGIVVPAEAMTATPEKLTAMAQGQQAAGAGGAGGAAPPQSAIPPIEPIAPAGPDVGQKQSAADDGVAYSPLGLTEQAMNNLSGRSQAVAALMTRR